MQASLVVCSRCAAYLQQGVNRGWSLLLPRHESVSVRGRRRETARICLRFKSSSRKSKKADLEKQCEVPAEGDGLPAVDCFPLEGNTSKSDYRATAGATLPLSVDAERYKSSSVGRFYLHHSEEGGVVSLPSVTTILESTMPKSSYFALRQWQRAIEQEVGEDEFSTFKRDLMGQGERFHKLVEKELLKKQEVRLSEEVMTESETEATEEKLVGASSDQLGQDESGAEEPEGHDEEGNLPEHAAEEVEAQKLQLVPARYAESVREVLSEIGEVVAVESVVRHLELGYMGRVDCIAQYRGVWCVIDWKTTRKPRPKLKDMYDAPLQVCAYMGAVNQDERYPVKVAHALLVAVYESGAPCDTHFLSDEQCRQHWEKWMMRLEEYKTCFAHDLSNVY